MATKSLTFDIYGRDKTASKTLKGVGDDVDRVGDRFKAFGAVAAAGLAAAAVAAVKFGAESVEAAGEAATNWRKTEKLFGDNADAIRDWSKDAAKSFGMSGRAAMGAAADFGNMYQQLGIAGKEAAKMSTKTVELAADLAAFNGLDTADVVDMISSAFRGEYDSLQRLIPNISDARVKTEALAMSGKTNADQLTAQEKAMAVLAIITNDGATAIGSAAERMDTAAGKADSLNARWDDMQVKVGTALLPALTGLMDFFETTVMPGLEDFASWFASDGLPALQGFFSWMSENKETLIPVAGGIAAVTAALWALNVALYANPIVLAIAGIVAGLAWLGATAVWVANDFEGATGTVVSAAQFMVDSLGNGWNQIQTWWGQLMAAFANGWAQITGAFSNGASQIAGFIAGINSNLASFVGTAIATLASLPGRIMGIFASAGSWLFSAGANIVGGLVRGIQSAIGQAIAAAARLAEVAAQAARSALQIKSPSRVFERIGEYVGEGFEIGIADSIGRMSRSMGNLVQMPMVDAASAGGGGYGSTIVTQLVLNDRIVAESVERHNRSLR